MGDEENKQNIVITYDTLFEILRKEKLREELQQLPDGFFSSLSSYLKEKKEFIKRSRSGLFTDEETDKANKQLQNIVKIIKELYNKRERKIVNMAINKAITGSSLIDTSQLLKEENNLFSRLLETMVLFRSNIVNRVINAEDISVPSCKEDAEFDAKKPSLKEEDNEEDDNGDYEKTPTQTKPQENSLNTGLQAGSGIKPDEKAKELKNNSNSESDIRLEMVKILVLEDIPKFIGPNLEIYGPYQKDSKAMMNSTIADILVESNKARIVHEQKQEPEKLDEVEE